MQGCGVNSAHSVGNNCFLCALVFSLHWFAQINTGHHTWYAQFRGLCLKSNSVVAAKTHNDSASHRHTRNTILTYSRGCSREILNLHLSPMAANTLVFSTRTEILSRPLTASFAM